MSELKPAQESNRQNLGSGPGAYAVLTIVAAGWMAMYFLRLDHPEVAMLLAAFVAAILVLRLWLVGAVLFLGQVFLLMEDPQGDLSIGDLPADSWMYAAAVLLLVVASTRSLALTADVLPYPATGVMEGLRRFFRTLRRRFGADASGSDPHGPESARLGSRDIAATRPDEVVAAVLRVVFSLLAAGVLLSAIPKRPDAIVRFGLLPSALRTTTVAWVLVGLFALSTVLFTPVQWLRHPTQEARLFLRSVLTRWCYADLARIARRHVNRRRKRNLRRLKTDRKNQSQLSGGASVQTEEG